MLLEQLFNKREFIINFHIAIVAVIEIGNITNQEFSFLKQFLNPEETNRCLKFINYECAKQFAFCRVFAKYTIAKHLSKKINNIEFLYTSNGKPYLQKQNLWFNVSHTIHFCAMAVSFIGDVGVDLEHIDITIDYVALLDFFASNDEKLWVMKKNSIKRFYQLWTAKEALIKQLGKKIDNVNFPHLIIHNKEFSFYNKKIYTLNLQNQYVLSVCLPLTSSSP
jgi:4'-phosphopantetheinyl transferase